MTLSQWKYHNPVAVTFGWGELRRLPALVAGRPVLLVIFPEARAIGLLAQVESLLGAQLRGVIEDVAPMPSPAWLQLHHGPFWAKYSDCVVVAIGGGSVLDSAKLLLTRPVAGGAEEILAAMAAGRKPSVAESRPLIAVPTTAGTGSEVTPWATFWDQGAIPPKKLSLHLPELFAEAALIDPALTLSLPVNATRICALDALSHALEAIWNIHANPVSDILAAKAARSIIATLPRLLVAPQDIALRTALAAASLEAGLAFSNTMTALAHSISYELTFQRGIPHGLASSLTLPLVWSLALGVSAERDQILGQIFGPDVSDGPAALESFLNSVGVSCDFADYGFNDDQMSEIVSAAMRGPRGRNFINSKP